MEKFALLVLLSTTFTTVCSYVLRLNVPEVVVHSKSHNSENAMANMRDTVEMPRNFEQDTISRHHVKDGAIKMKKNQRKLEKKGWSYAAHILKNKKTPVKGDIEKKVGQKAVSNGAGLPVKRDASADRIAKIVSKPMTYWFTMDENQKEAGKLPFFEKEALIDDDSLKSHNIENLDQETEILARSEISTQGVPDGMLNSKGSVNGKTQTTSARNSIADKGSIVDEESDVKKQQIKNNTASPKARNPSDNEVDVGSSQGTVSSASFDQGEADSTKRETDALSSGSDDALPLKEEGIDDNETVDTYTGDTVTLNDTFANGPSSADTVKEDNGTKSSNAVDVDNKVSDRGNLMQSALMDSEQGKDNPANELKEEMEEDVDKEEEESGMRMEQGIDDNDYVDTTTGEIVDLNSEENEVKTDQKGGDALDDSDENKDIKKIKGSKGDQKSNGSSIGTGALAKPLQIANFAENATKTNTTNTTSTGRPKSLLEGIDISEFTNSINRDQILHQTAHVPAIHVKDEFSTEDSRKSPRDEFSADMGGLVVDEEPTLKAAVDLPTETKSRDQTGTSEGRKDDSKEGLPDEFNQKSEVKTNDIANANENDTATISDSESGNGSLDKENFDNKAGEESNVSIFQGIEKEKNKLLKEAQSVFNTADKEEHKLAELEFNSNFSDATVGEFNKSGRNGDEPSATEEDKGSQSESDLKASGPMEKDEFNDNTSTENDSQTLIFSAPNNAEYNETSDISENMNNTSFGETRGVKAGENGGDSESQTWTNGPEFHPSSENGDAGPSNGEQQTADLTDQKVSDNEGAKRNDSESNEFDSNREAPKTDVQVNATGKSQGAGRDEFGEAKQVMNDLSKKITKEFEDSKDTVFKPVNDRSELSILQSKLDTAKKLYADDPVN
eukprot:gene5281-433_t